MGTSKRGLATSLEFGEQEPGRSGEKAILQRSFMPILVSYRISSILSIARIEESVEKVLRTLCCFSQNRSILSISGLFIDRIDIGAIHMIRVTQSARGYRILLTL